MTGAFADLTRAYHDEGLVVVPFVPGTKTAAVQWARWQVIPQTHDEVERLVDEHPAADIAVLCGGSAGIVAIDTDGPEGERQLRHLGFPVPHTAIIESPGGLKRVYRSHRPVPTRIGVRRHLDILGERRCMIVPNSTGRRWLTPEGFKDIAPLPPEWIALSERHGPLIGPALHRAEILGVPEGRRNATLAALVGSWLTGGVPISSIHRRAAAFAGRCAPPMDAAEANAVVESVNRSRARTRSPEREAFLAAARERGFRHPALTVLVALVTLRGELGLTAAMFAPNRKLASLAGVPLASVRSGLKALEEAGLVEVHEHPPPPCCEPKDCLSLGIQKANARTKNKSNCLWSINCIEPVSHEGLLILRGAQAIVVRPTAEKWPIQETE